MSRVVFDKGEQKDFLDKIRKKSGLKWSNIAKVCNVSERTIRDWRREKFYMKYEAARILCAKISAQMCQPRKVLSEYWSIKKIAARAAKRRYELYGNPGTPEGRRRGGLKSQKKFRENPVYAKRLGVKIKKIIKKPKFSPELAEFVGILLGDGGITNYQVTITFNRETDREYSFFMQKLTKRLFGLSPSIISGNAENNKADKIVIYSRNLVEFLLKKGLKNGNKLYNKIDIPNWVKNKQGCKISCLRGLIDTDGSFYFYKHRVKQRTYNNFAMCFTSYSDSLLNFVHNVLKELEFSPSRTHNHVYLHKKADIKKYFKIIKSHNHKHIKKYKKIICEEEYGSGYNRTVSKTV